MPTYLDVHNVDGGVSAADVAGAHQIYRVSEGH